MHAVACADSFSHHVLQVEGFNGRAFLSMATAFQQGAGLPREDRLVLMPEFCYNQTICGCLRACLAAFAVGSAFMLLDYRSTDDSAFESQPSLSADSRTAA